MYDDDYVDDDGGDIFFSIELESIKISNEIIYLMKRKYTL